MPEFDPEPRERCKCVDDESTPVASMVVTVIGIETRLDRAVDADRVRDSLVFSPGVGLPMSAPGTTSQNAQPESVCCITLLLRRRHERRSSLDERQRVGGSS